MTIGIQIEHSFRRFISVTLYYSPISCWLLQFEYVKFKYLYIIKYIISVFLYYWDSNKFQCAF
jgi:hypothetical protein